MTKFLTLLISTMLMMLFVSVAMAVEPSAVVVPGQSIADSIIAFIGSGSGAMIIAAVVEFALRLVKSDKPLSILHLVGGVLKVFGNLALKIGEFLDKVLPQNVAK